MARLVRIREVAPLDAHRVRLTLTDGSVVERDLGPYLTGPVFDTIRRDPAAFSLVRVDAGTLVWPDGADLCPDLVVWGGPPPADAGTRAA